MHARYGTPLLLAVALGCHGGHRDLGAQDAGGTEDAGAAVVWVIDNLESVGGFPVTVVGEPTLIDIPGGKAALFDGVNDALFLQTHPLAGLARFTVEVIFRPDSGGAAEQRFFHMQAAGSQDRVMFETRLTPGDQWFLDTFIQSGGMGVTLLAEAFLHPIGPWYHAAIVVDGGKMRHYVNGVEEMSADLAYQPQAAGTTSLGVRINMVNWYKGAIRLARFTPRALAPSELLSP